MSSAPLTIWEACLLGLVEGLTEFLPVSSTGHLILVSTILGRANDPSIKSFQIVIQIGAILAVVGVYQERIVSILRGLVGADRSGIRLLRNLVIAVIPAAVTGLMLGPTIKTLLFRAGPVAAALAAGGIAIIAIEPLLRSRSREGRPLSALTARRALVIGLLQCIALWPGISRSLVTILGGLAVGLSPAAAAEFSFLLAIPVLGGAAIYETIVGGQEILTGVGPLPLAAGLVVSLASAAVAVRGFVRWLESHGLSPFGVYRLLLALLVLIWIV